MRFAPHKLGKVGGLMAKYAGDEDKLLRIVRRKYVSTGTKHHHLLLPRENGAARVFTVG